ncbi:asparagine--tRNA ligase [Candidatus Woesearchaeota archaeon]|nr:asparagine--tRNA ligase [Candidatus Woesearchaeota archaeon]
MMLGPYKANNDRTISYQGNKIFVPIGDIVNVSYPTDEVEDRVRQFNSDPMWGRIARINHQINMGTNNYFDRMGALFTALPLTTRMISSPGAVYGKEAIDYTSDTCPITLKWFKQKKNAFLSESSQIYLELALMQEGVDHAYSIYNSFRKEEADATHLSEFHHVEYEGKIDQSQNNVVALGLVGRILRDLITDNEEDLAFFLSEEKIGNLGDLAENIQRIPQITFKEALNALYDDTKKDKYRKFTMNENFGSWEEIRLTEIYGNMVAVSQFPLLEVPFYHAMVEGVVEKWTEHKVDIIKGGILHWSNPFPTPAQAIEYDRERSSLVADNTDFIWPGYRETIGSGHRVRSISELEEKARIFNLPREDYQPYLQSRELPGYVETSGFGLGWERLLQGLLEMPFIWSATQFPRGHTTLKP